MVSLDFGLGMSLVHMLHSSAEPAFAMFSEVLDTSYKRAMILAAARKALTPDDLEMFEAVADVARMQTDVRNKFAHWLWGESPQVPDALILTEPRFMLGHARNVPQKFVLPINQ